MVQNCCEALQEKLFLLNPIFRKALFSLRGKNFQMQENLRFISVDCHDVLTSDD